MNPAAEALDLSPGVIGAKTELAAEVLRKFGHLRMKAHGESMLPSIWPGDVLTVRRRAFAQLRPGQVVLYTRKQTSDADSGQGGELVAHRVVARAGGHLITRGDSLPYLDPPVEEPQVLGEVVAAMRKGRPVEFGFTPHRRALAWVLRRSGIGSRVLLRLGR